TLLAADAWWLGDIALYESDPGGALSAHERARRSRFYSAMQRLPEHRSWAALHLGRACLLASQQRRDRARLSQASRLARAPARALARERYALGPAAAAQLRAGVAMLRGDRELALSELSRALEGYESSSFLLYAAAVRHRIGCLRGGDDGRASVERALVAGRAL